MGESFIGEIKLFAGRWTPVHWALCDGRTLPIQQNPALFSVIGNHYGGDGRVNFQLPNLAPMREADGGETPIRYIICLNGMYPPRS